MKVPLNWLREYIDVPADIQEVSRVFTSLGYMLDGKPKEIEGDTVLDLEVRQNRGDCLSLIGLARELSAYYEIPVRLPNSDSKLLTIPSKQLITIADPNYCYRFSAMKITGIKNMPTPDWMRTRLEAYGIKSINTLIDITNYVMIEYGQPLHGYDVRKLHSDSFTIRPAHANESITLFGNKQIKLTTDDIVVSDDTVPISLGGIMGGLETGLSADTTEIILESAKFNQANVRRTTVRHKVRTEGSTRQEKFIHPKLTEIALCRAATLIVELLGGEVVDYTDIYPTRQEFNTRKLDLSFIKTAALAGVKLTKQEIMDNLTRFGFEISKTQETYCHVTVPYYRTDIELEEDLIEEVIRLYGYDNIPATLPATPAPKQIDSPIYVLEESVRDILTACGYDEQITESLTHYDNPRDDVITLQNALTSEKDMLRTTLQDGLIHGVRNRIKYREDDIRLFEIGRVYLRKSEKLSEESRVGIVLSGTDANYRVLKGIMESIFDRLGRSYSEKLVNIQQILDLPLETYYVEVSLEPILAMLADTDAVQVLTVPPQIIKRDISCMVPKETRVGELLQKIQSINSEMIHVSLGEDPRMIEDDMKSVFINIEFWSTENNLTENDILPLFEKIQGMMKKDLKALLR